MGGSALHDWPVSKENRVACGVGYLCHDRQYQGKGLGDLLLVYTLMRTRGAVLSAPTFQLPSNPTLTLHGYGALKSPGTGSQVRRLAMKRLPSCYSRYIVSINSAYF